MSTYSIADAKTHLAKLVDLALGGESIVITRRGRPVVTLTPVQPALPQSPPHPTKQTGAPGIERHREPFGR
jgi:prevent-host-death family protein